MSAPDPFAADALRAQRADAPRPWGGTPLARVVEPEALDALAADDPRAQRARRDLRRIHRAMATRRLLTGALRSALPGPRRPLRMMEIGCGDATLLAALAPRLPWPRVTLTLVDRQPAVSLRTLARFDAAGWQPQVQAADVFAALSAPAAQNERIDVVVATLFLHHFDDDALALLLARVAQRSRALVAIEPRRSRLALSASRLVALLGASAVTRADAVTSVRAGFCGRELSARWPLRSGWRLQESAAGAFSHVFIATRTDGEDGG
jgi:SAM-dependent methyltransferase